jgi:hypothetical protein
MEVGDRDEQRVRALLPEAKQGDEDAVYAVAMYVFKRSKWRIRGFYSTDPAYDREDIEDAFLHGILKAIPEHRPQPDPLLYIAQSGYFSAASMLRKIKPQEYQRRTVSLEAATATADGEIAGLHESTAADEEDFREIVIDRTSAAQRVVQIRSTALREKPALALEAILTGSVGDPTELGFNKRLAGHLGVSPQRASQVMAELRESVDGS